MKLSELIERLNIAQVSIEEDMEVLAADSGVAFKIEHVRISNEFSPKLQVILDS